MNFVTRDRIFTRRVHLSRTLPLFSCHRRSGDSMELHLALVDLAEKTAGQCMEDIAADLLCEEEKTILAGFSYRKRRKEWLGGRLAAKHALMNALHLPCRPGDFAALSILPEPDGSPRPGGSLLSGKTGLSLSISHSDRYALGMASADGRCGIDIQRLSDKTLRVADRFSSEKERDLLRAAYDWQHPREYLTMLWAAKEALKKAMLHDQPVIFQGVVLQRITADTGSGCTLYLDFPGAHQPAPVTVLFMDEFALAYTFLSENHARTA